MFGADLLGEEMPTTLYSTTYTLCHLNKEKVGYMKGNKDENFELMINTNKTVHNIKIWRILNCKYLVELTLKNDGNSQKGQALTMIVFYLSLPIFGELYGSETLLFNKSFKICLQLEELWKARL